MRNVLDLRRLPTPAPLRPLRRAARRLRDRLRSTSLVLLYHRVAVVPDDPWSLCVGPEHFDEQMDVLARRGGVAPFVDVAEGVASGRRCPRRIAVTFDDGYADFASAALPVLERHEIPVTLFATTGHLDGRAEFWWDALARRILSAASLPPRVEVTLDGRSHVWETAAWDRAALYLEMHAVLGRATDAARATALDGLRDAAEPAHGPRPSHRPLTAAELQAVAARSCVTIGAHTVSHPYLSALPASAQEREIVESRRCLQALTGLDVVDFSYPHGDRDATTTRLVRGAGFRRACGTACEAASATSDPYAVPRVEVPDLGGEAFGRWIDDWMGGA